MTVADPEVGSFVKAALTVVSRLFQMSAGLLRRPNLTFLQLDIAKDGLFRGGSVCL